MAGFENTIVYSSGEKLMASSSRDILNMQNLSTDVSRINHTGSPEGVVSANPSSLCHDPVSGFLYLKATGTGNTGWVLISTGGGGSGIVTLAGDSGSATGSTVTLFAGVASQNCGSTVQFVNSAALSELNVSDGGANTIIGQGSGSLALSGTGNTSLGTNVFALVGGMSGNANVAVGDSCLIANSNGSNNTTVGYFAGSLIDGGGNNTFIGYGSGSAVTSGSNNVALGYLAGLNYAGNEQSNISIGANVTGTVGESGVTRIGAGGVQTACYIDGITGVTVASSNLVTVDANGQLGQSPVTVSASGATGNPSQPAFNVVYSTDANNITGDGTTYQLLWDALEFQQGTMYDPSTGISTLPQAGFYLFTLNVTLTGLTVAHNFLQITETSTGYSIAYLNPSTVNSGGFLCVNASFVRYWSGSTPISFDLTVNGSTLTVGLQGPSSGLTYNFMSAFLIC